MSAGMECFTCTTCQVAFEVAEEHRKHHRSEWHRYNLKRVGAGLAPSSNQLFRRKLEILAENEGFQPKRGKGHLKTGKESKPAKTSNGLKMVVDASALPSNQPYRLGFSLFDNIVNENIEDLLMYMRETYGFSIPDDEYLVDKKGLLQYLGEKLWVNHQCLFCNRAFQSLHATRDHMASVGHMQIGTSTDELLEELEPFYDYSKSYQEIIERCQAKGEKVRAIKNKLDESMVAEVVGKVEGNGAESEWEDVGELSESEEGEDWDEVFEQLGLQPAEITEAGSLRVPTGREVPHRSATVVSSPKTGTLATTSKAMEKLRELKMLHGSMNGARVTSREERRDQTQHQKKVQTDMLSVGVQSNKLAKHFRRQDLNWG